jgi:hypothetical protein
MSKEYRSARAVHVTGTSYRLVIILAILADFQDNAFYYIRDVFIFVELRGLERFAGL